MDEDNIKLILEDLQIEPEVAEEFMEVFKERMGGKMDAERIARLAQDREFLLKNIMPGETDWRRKAAIAAQIISNNL